MDSVYEDCMFSDVNMYTPSLVMNNPVVEDYDLIGQIFICTSNTELNDFIFIIIFTLQLIATNYQQFLWNYHI